MNHKIQSVCGISSSLCKVAQRALVTYHSSGWL